MREAAADPIERSGSEVVRIGERAQRAHGGVEVRVEGEAQRANPLEELLAVGLALQIPGARGHDAREDRDGQERARHQQDELCPYSHETSRRVPPPRDAAGAALAHRDCTLKIASWRRGRKCGRRGMTRGRAIAKPEGTGARAALALSCASGEFAQISGSGTIDG
jgi:hypothetical protein